MPPPTKPLPVPPNAETWTDEERSAWAPPEQLSSAEWAEKHRELSRRQSSRPGKWRNANQPALVGLMYLCSRPGIHEIWAKKSAQFGASEGVRNVIGHRAHLDPVPVMLVLPDEKAGRKIVRKRIIPLFEDTPVLRRLLTGNTRDKKLTTILLTNGFELSLAWAGSPSAMASDPYAIVILDEVDKYNAASLQADPVAESRVRLRTYGDAGLLIALSTPSTPLGPIAVGYDDCPIKVSYFVHCPHCGTPQRMTFDRLRWEKFKDIPAARDRAAEIRDARAAWVECANPLCHTTHPAGEGRILEHHKRAIFKGGFWATDDLGWRIYADGREEGTKPKGDKVGLHIHALIDLSVTFAAVAAEFVEADGRKDKLKDFYNLTLGEEFKELSSAVTVSVFSKKCRPDDETGFVPPAVRMLQPWVSRLIMTVDTQKDHFWYVIRGWGYGMRSHRVHHGRASTFQEIEELYYRAAWPYVDNCYQPLCCFGGAPLGIDSGGGMDRDTADASITDRVYQWCLNDPIWRLPLKGASKPFDGHVRWRDVTYQDPLRKRTPYVVRLHLVDPIHCRDILTSYFTAKVSVIDHTTGEVTGEIDQWQLNDLDDAEYNTHLANVVKSPFKKGRTFIERYTTRTAGARKDLHDCETYQIAWALYGPGKCFALPSPEQLAKQHAAAQQAASAPRSTGIRMPDGRSFLSTQRR